MSTCIKIYLAILVIVCGVSFVFCAKILAVFPTPSISHQIIFRPLTQELVKRGHQVTVITTDPAFPKGQSPLNLTEIDVHDLSYKLWLEVWLKENIGNKKDIFSQIEVIFRTMGNIFLAQMANNEVQNILYNKNTRFDLLLLEPFVIHTIALSHLIKVPVIQISSFGGFKWNYETVGASTHPLLYPTPLRQKLYNLTTLEKLQELYNDWRIVSILKKFENEHYLLLQKIFGNDIPPIRELLNNVHLLFLNIHPIWTDNQPIPPNVVYIRGIHKNPPKLLPPDLDSFMNKSKNGIIYFSLGTNVKPSHLSPAQIKMMIKVFSRLPYDIIWKWDLGSLPGITENIRIYKWLPQSDLLRHPKVKLFITQGGLQSTDEAIDAAVPLIGIPMLGDQWYNTDKYSYHKIGIKLDLPSLTEEVFQEAIESVISDKSYRENIKKLRTYYEDEPQNPLERAVWWTEYVLRHGSAKHLRAAGANITWAQYIEFELVTIVLLVLLSASCILYCLLYKIIATISRTIRSYVKTKIS